jgi:hypothetical protein
MSAPDASALGGRQDDAELIAAEQELDVVWQEHKAAPCATDEEAAACDLLYDRLASIEDMICTTAPRTMAGCAVKMRLLCHPDRGPFGERDLFEVHCVAARQILAFIEAQAQGGAA